MDEELHRPKDCDLLKKVAKLSPASVKDVLFALPSVRQGKTSASWLGVATGLRELAEEGLLNSTEDSYGDRLYAITDRGLERLRRLQEIEPKQTEFRIATRSEVFECIARAQVRSPLVSVHGVQEELVKLSSAISVAQSFCLIRESLVQIEKASSGSFSRWKGIELVWESSSGFVSKTLELACFGHLLAKQMEAEAEGEWLS